jgi:general nucleoside transport system permease protein
VSDTLKIPDTIVGRSVRLAAQLDLRQWLPVAATGVALLIGLALVALAARSPIDAFSAFVEGAFGSAYAVGASINRAVVLALVGIGFAFAERANLTNVGGEGQIALGGMAATAFALHAGAAALPGALAWAWPLLGGIVAGALWGALAGVLRVRFGTNEVISTLLLTFIAIWIVYWATHAPELLRQPQTSATSLPESPDIPTATQLPLLLARWSPASPLHIGVLFTLAAAAIVGFVLARTPIGVRLRAIGLNELAARRAGIAPGRLIVVALAVAGALAGLAGALMIQGEQYNLKSGFSSGYGFDGLVVGLLARGSTTAILGYALFFGILRSGGINMEISAGVPSAVVQVMQGLVVVLVAGSAFLSARSQRAP